jgi:phytoene desaturase
VEGSHAVNGNNRAVVVGAGVGGLAVAARLASQGWAVTVFEQADTVGGKLGLFERNGFRFDTGPSIITMPQVFEKLFADTGAPLDTVLKLRRLDPIARYRFADGTWLDASATDTAFLSNVEAMRAGNGAQLGQFLKRSEAIWDATHETFLERELKPSDLFAQSRRVRDLITIAPWKTMRGLAKAQLDDPRLVSFVDRYATYTGSDPRRAPAALASIPHVERVFGGWYIEGGLRELASALETRCRELGVAIETNADVSEVVISRRKATGVTVGGKRVEADVVVANADARHLYADLLPGKSLRPVSSYVGRARVRPDPSSGKAHRALRRLDRSQPSLSGFVMCLAVRGETPNLAHHTVLFPERYDDEFDDLFGAPPQPVREPTIYASVPRDPLVAPPGHEAWFVLMNAPRHTPGDSTAGVDWKAPGLADRYADRILDLMAERGVDIRNRVLWRELRTPADLEERTRAVGGSIYGTSSNGAKAAFLRPANRSPFEGLYLVGGSSHPGGGLPLVTLSAQIVARMIGRPTD